MYLLVSKARCLIRRHLQPLYIEAPADEAGLCTRPGAAMSISWCLAILLNKGENWHADESSGAVVLLSLSRLWHRVKSIPCYPSGGSVSNSWEAVSPMSNSGPLHASQLSSSPTLFAWGAAPRGARLRPALEIRLIQFEQLVYFNFNVHMDGTAHVSISLVRPLRHVAATSKRVLHGLRLDPPA